jgi:DNA-binding Lrp family transcriptional regulator
MQLLSTLQLDLIEAWQRELPLVPRPFAAIAEHHQVSENTVIEALAGLREAGVLSRVGATLRPNTAGASLLAAMKVPVERLDEVARIVNDEPGVNHNYEREHAYNLWFVVTGGDRASLGAALARINSASGLDILELPLERSYHIDLGFSLATSRSPGLRRAPQPAASALDAQDRCLLQALEHGLVLEPRPFDALAASCGATQADVIVRIQRLIAAGVITRFGLIVRHRPLGYASNAMAVWDVPDGEVDEIGARLAQEPAVTLCYRRPRRLPHWPYNLFCMVHGREQSVVREEIGAMARRAGVDGLPGAVLFSRRCFRQRGPTLRAA